MSGHPQTNLDAIHDAIVTAISTAFPHFAAVQAYREETNRVTLPTPACLVELTELEAAPEHDAGTGQLAMVAGFAARIILGFRHEQAKRAIRALSGALAAFIHQQRWGVQGQIIGPAVVLGAWPDDFSPELDQYEVWRVEWQHVVYVGTEVSWDDASMPPRQVYVSWVPRVGIPHEPDYLEITGNPPAPAPAPDPEPEEPAP